MAGGVGKLLDALSPGGVIMIYGALDMSPAMIDPIKGLAKLATVKFISVFETILVAEKRAKMTDFVAEGSRQRYVETRNRQDISA